MKKALSIVLFFVSMAGYSQSISTAPYYINPIDSTAKIPATINGTLRNVYPFDLGKPYFPTIQRFLDSMAAVSSEITNRTNADNNLQTQITSNTNNITSNTTNITANTNSITSNTNAIGTLSALTTTAKSNLVSAINEVKAGASGVSATSGQLLYGTGTGVTSSANFIFNGTLEKMVSNAAPSAAANIYELYSSDNVLRTKVRSHGTQAWYLNNTVNEIGSIEYSTPNGAPGIVFFNASGTGRSQISMNSASGGLAFGATTTAANPATAMVVNTNGNITIGTTTDVPSAKLQVSSTTQGFLPPKMTTIQRDAIASPAEGLMIYNTSTHQMNYYNGSSWIAF